MTIICNASAYQKSEAEERFVTSLRQRYPGKDAAGLYDAAPKTDMAKGWDALTLQEQSNWMDFLSNAPSSFVIH